MTECREPDAQPGFFTGLVEVAMARKPWETAVVLATFARPVREDDDLLTTLTTLVRLAVRTVGAADHATVTLEHPEHGFTVVHLDEQGPVAGSGLDELEDGPHLEAVRTARVVAAALGDGSWDRCAGPARAAGVSSVVAAPLRLGGAAAGALSLHGTGAVPLDRSDTVLLQVLVESASRFLHDLLEVDAQTRDVADIRGRHVAAAEVAGSAPLTEDQLEDLRAFAALRAQAHERTVREIADRLRPGRGRTAPGTPGHAVTD